jgi:hypothetical protein
VNLYAYVENDPVDLLDPYGLVTGKIDGRVIQVHKTDVDPWPSSPHGHIYDKNQVVDINGTIYNKTTGKIVGKICRKAMPRLLELFERANWTLQIIEMIIDAGTMKEQFDEQTNYMTVTVPYDTSGNPLPNGQTRSVRVPKGGAT